MENESKGEVALVTPTTRYQPVNLMPLTIQEIHERPAVYTTLDVSKVENRGRLYDLIIEGGENADKFIGQTFGIEEIVMHPVVVTDKATGEQHQLVRTVLLTFTGDVIQFVSNGILACITAMKDCGWRPFGIIPQDFTLTQVPLPDGKRMFKLVRAKPVVTAKKK